MMESKLLVGGKSIIDKTTEQERALEERRKQIAEQQVYSLTCTGIRAYVLLLAVTYIRRSNKCGFWQIFVAEAT